MWGAYGYYYRQGWNSTKDYDEMKHEVNEQAKRQILRKCKQFMIENGFTAEHVKALKGTTEKTYELYQKTLNLKAVG